MQLQDEDRVKVRLATVSDFEKFRKKVFDLRRLVAGDLSPLLDSPRAENDSPDAEFSSLDIYDFLVTYYHEGKSNKIQQYLKVLLYQTSYSFPTIEFEDLTPEEAAINHQYSKIRLGPSPRGCNAKDHMRLTLLDYMIGGIGWSKACLRDEKPVLMHCDSLDMSWDRQVRIPSDIRWASCKFREPLWVWIDMFGSDAFQDEATDGVDLENIVELEWYYDVEGPEGNWYVYRSFDGECIKGAPIHKAPNPYYFMLDGKKQPFIPYEPMFYLALPSLRMPIGIVEGMIPSQKALWDSEEYMRQTLERGTPFYQMPKGTLDDEEAEKFADGEIGAVIQTKNNQVITRTPGITIDPQVLNWNAKHENELQGQSGANPYAAGGRVAGTNFAAEVNAIQGQSGLQAGTIAKDLAAFWERSVRKFLAVGSAYDDLDIDIRLDTVELKFNQQDPIKKYLRPDAELLISEETMKFRPQQDKLQEAVVDLQTAMSLQQIFPEAVKKAYEAYLRARGIKDIDSWLRPPQQPQMPPQGAPGQTPPGADAAPLNNVANSLAA